MYTVSEFCRRIERDLNGFIEEIAAINRNVSSREKEAMASSYPCVSKLLSLSMKKKPELANVLLILFFFFRKPWIEKPLVRFLASLLLSK